MAGSILFGYILALGYHVLLFARICFHLIIQQGNNTALVSGLGEKVHPGLGGTEPIWCFCTGFLILGARSVGFDFQTIYPGFLILFYLFFF